MYIRHGEQLRAPSEGVNREQVGRIFDYDPYILMNEELLMMVEMGQFLGVACRVIRGPEKRMAPGWPPHAATNDVVPVKGRRLKTKL